MTDAISIEQTNRLRASIGLPPLALPGSGPTFRTSNSDGDDSDSEEKGSTLETRQAAGYGNWKKLQDEADAKSKREAKNEAIKKARDAARRFAKLEGAGLGDDDGQGDMDTKTWLIQQKKRQKKLEKARKLEKELAEREEQAEYTSADLAGVKVGHEVGDFLGDEEQVLTLKDTTIDENEEEGDELENVQLREQERLGEKLELKKKRPVYNPNDFDESGKQTVLAQYDEEIDGKKSKRFTLTGTGTAAEKEALKEEIREKMKAAPISLDVKGTTSISDYLDQSEIKLRKPKKKKAKTLRRKVAVDEDEDGHVTTPNVDPPNEDAMDVDPAEAMKPAVNPKKRSYEDASFVDDDDLQATLAIQRRNALKQRKRIRPEDIAKQMREEQSATPGLDETLNKQETEEEGGLVIDETSEFVANLSKPSATSSRDQARAKRQSGAVPTAISPPAPKDADVRMRDASPSPSPSSSSSNDDDANADAESHLKRETSTPGATPTAGLTSTGLTDETTLTQGVGATLAMLSQRGLIKKSSEGDDLNARDRDRQRFLTEKQRREAEAEARARQQRERDRASGKLDRMSAREKEAYAQHENKARDTYESRAMADVFNREYRPDVNIKYTDDFGRDMSAKEAFKHLSHQFHGKGSGKQKTEKRLKKIESEKKREAMSSLDSSQATGMNNAMGVTAKRNRQAGVRLA
ncbi:MAG: hypothetical protein M1825_002867 [Sarcosagium campestre]|nr:MAG: hypothetical protein M1825_002867 [Sarcosagium campestre]